MGANMATIGPYTPMKERGHYAYHPHPGQLRALNSTRRFPFIIAGTQGGKTSFIPVWLAQEIKRQGPGDYLAVTATYDLFKLKFLPEMRRVFVEMAGMNEDKSDRVFWSGKGADQTRIILRSASSEGGLESATVKAAVLDECGQDEFGIGAWEAVQRRLSLSRGRALGATTPYNLGWLKQEIYDKWRQGDPDIEVIQFASIQNPHFPRDEYERAKRTLPAWKFEMFYNGNFTRPAGLIYSDYIDDYRENGGHLVRPFDIPPEWPRYIGVDFGAVHTATDYLAHDPEANIYYWYAAYLEGDMTTQQHALRFKFRAAGVNVTGITGGAGSETQQRMDWTAEGVPVQAPAIKEVEPGIDRVTALFKQKRLYVFDNLANARDELGTYSREVDEYGQATEKIKDKEAFHLLDALRYDCIGLESTITTKPNPFYD